MFLVCVRLSYIFTLEKNQFLAPKGLANGPLWSIAPTRIVNSPFEQSMSSSRALYIPRSPLVFISREKIFNLNFGTFFIQKREKLSDVAPLTVVSFASESYAYPDDANIWITSNKILSKHLHTTYPLGLRLKWFMTL